MSQIQPAQQRSILARIFLSPEEPRLRAGWRLLIQTFLMIVLAIIATIAAVALMGSSEEVAASVWANVIIQLIAFTVSVYIARRWLDKRSFASLGLKLDGHTLPDILAGIGIAGVQIGFIFVLMLAVGWATFEGFAWEVDPLNTVITGVLTFFAIYVIVGWQEELLSRGYHLQTIASGTNVFWGVVISSSIFGVLHLGNPNVTWVNAVLIAAGIFLAGVYLAYGYLRTKQLWLPIGLHIGWNFFEGVVFGFPVSGMDSYRLIRTAVQGPEYLTGGAFGPESGLIVVPALLLGCLLIYLYTRSRAR